MRAPYYVVITENNMSGKREAFLAKLKGTGIRVVAAENFHPHWLDKLSTGVLALDYALRGGYPAGGIINLFGREGSGKDMLMNLAIASCQQKYGANSSVLWVTFGAPPDVDYMRMCGVKIRLTEEDIAKRRLREDQITDELVGVTVGTVDVLDLSEKAKDSVLESQAEYVLEAVLGAVESRAYNLIIVNEIGSGAASDAVKKELAEAEKMASWSSLFTRFLKKFYTIMGRREGEEGGGLNNTIVIFGNPTRANVDAYSAKFNPIVQTSGQALKHAATITLQLQAGAVIREGKKKAGKPIIIKVVKAKHGSSEGEECQFDFLFNHGPDLVADTIRTALLLNAIEKVSGKAYMVPGPTGKVRIEAASADDLVEILGEADSQHSGLFKYVRSAAKAEIQKIAATPVGHD
jgi:RecA/RadA recombinase